MTVELCHCCAAAVINSGSRWSVLFCDECRLWVIALNKSYGAAVVPHGRHSMMNGFGLSGKDAQDDRKITRFANDFQAFGKRMERPRDWRRNLVVDYLAETRESVPVAAYLTAAMDRSPGTTESFRQLCVYFGVEPALEP